MVNSTPSDNSGPRNGISHSTTVDAMKAPTVARVGTNRIVIDGLPVPAEDVILDKCELMKIVHRYKHYLTHGCPNGIREARRRRKAGERLENEALILPVAYSCCLSQPLKDGPAQLCIYVWYSDARRPYVSTSITPPENVVFAEPRAPQEFKATGDSVVDQWHNLIIKRHQQHQEAEIKANRIPEGYRPMCDEEMRKYFDGSMDDLVIKLQGYLSRVYNRALSLGIEPDYFNSPASRLPPVAAQASDYSSASIT